MVEAVGSGPLILAASKPELPGIDDFMPPEILFQGTPFAMNRIIFVRFIAMVVILLVLGITAARAKLIPSRWQGAVEWLIEFVRDSIVYEVMGELRGRRYVPMITTIFLTVMCFNLCGIIPGLNIAATATITMPLVFAVWTLIQYIVAGVRSQGLGKYLKQELFPAGVPWPIYILLTPIQLLEMLVIKPASLTIRLFANMIAGHLLVAISLAFAQFYIIVASNKLLVLAGAGWFALGFALTAFEIFVAALQAYVFAILSTVYINQSYPEVD
ncbi:ATP synthase subunit A [Bifidobacterium actinocoloniiforme DSM 22766]|uniref:ATP synthase subunit a n=1 Tax=Bifidobacterium actinocoloniiforme DSM 22766 TaxID=1437605 RepID=A0A086YVU2_9BIFI|nr:F0F1 ATP synthase subunit A [Bifidobacterium actinocoloniiforme]AKV54952.1 ATP synthase F0F1 subunit A [Bifidobacterium actinocoloniiforme DSM 22766]KFI38392.1 ATP synthase subunit A [Bifidobacterium actinocoloniiforme DSM 22766]